MANRSIPMRMAREILRLYFGLHLKKRQIGRACGVTPSTVVDYVRRAEEAGLAWPLPEDLDDVALEAMLSNANSSPKPAARPLPVMEEIHCELREKGVTLQLLWLEYKERCPDGYQYKRFCELYHQWAKHLEVSLRQEHRAGEKMFIDFAGKEIPITDPSTGEVTEAEIFVAVLGASNRKHSPHNAFLSGSEHISIPSNIFTVSVKY